MSRRPAASVILLAALLAGCPAAGTRSDSFAEDCKGSASELLLSRIGGEGTDLEGLLLDVARRRALVAEGTVAAAGIPRKWTELLEQTKEEALLKASGGNGEVTMWHTKAGVCPKAYELALKKPHDASSEDLCEVDMLEELNLAGAASYIPMLWASSGTEMLMERFQYDLFHAMRTPSYSFSDVGKWTYEMFIGLKKLHHLGFCHRDIKPENVMITGNNQAKLVDLGAACYLPNRQARDGSKCDQKENQCDARLAGTPLYMSYQVLTMTSEDCRADDFWALGLTVGQLLARDVNWPSFISSPFFSSKSWERMDSLKATTNDTGSMDKAISKLPQEPLQRNILQAWLSLSSTGRGSVTEEAVLEWAKALGAPEPAPVDSQLPKCAENF